MRGDIAAALVPLERALTLAEPEAYVRVFVDEGGPMAALLQAATTRRIDPALLTGWAVDQAALYGLLGKVRDLGLPLIAVHRRTEQ